ncbi:MAG: sensor histidine kinase [Solirubrobacteraceae bacterium]
MRDLRERARSAVRWALIPFRTPLRFVRERPVAPSLVAAAVMLVTPAANGFGAVGSVLVCVLSYLCGAHASLRSGALAVATLAAAMQVSMGFSEFPNVEITFITAIPFWVGYQVGLRSSLVGRLAKRTRELQDEQEAYAELSVRRERARIARELHDIVAHHLAVIVVQAGAGRIAAPAPGRRASERFATIRQSGGQALDEIARLVDVLHADESGEQHGARRWELLIDEARAGGVHVRLDPLPADVRLPGPVADDAYRIVREGLTNAIKHAPGADVTVHVARHGDFLQIELRDNGFREGVRLGDAGAGLGLVGIRERVESTGGTLSAGPEPEGGWLLRASVPVAQSSVLSSR